MTDMRAEWFWTDRWFASSAMGLPLEARGLYRELLSRAWSFGGSLPNDLQALRRLAGATENEWLRSWPLVEPYWVQASGRLVNETQLEVLREAQSRKDAARELGRLGGRRRAETGKRGPDGRFETQAPGPSAWSFAGESAGPKSPSVSKPPSPSLSLNPQENTSSKKGASFDQAQDKNGRLTVEEAFEVWNEIAVRYSLPRILGGRAKLVPKVRALLRNLGRHGTEHVVGDAMEAFAKQPFIQEKRYSLANFLPNAEKYTPEAIERAEQNHHETDSQD